MECLFLCTCVNDNTSFDFIQHRINLWFKIVALRALSSFAADRTPSGLSDGPPDIQSLGDGDSCSREVDKLSSDSDSDSSSSDEELDSAEDSA